MTRLAEPGSSAGENRPSSVNRSSVNGVAAAVGTKPVLPGPPVFGVLAEVPLDRVSNGVRPRFFESTLFGSFGVRARSCVCAFSTSAFSTCSSSCVSICVSSAGNSVSGIRVFLSPGDGQSQGSSVFSMSGTGTEGTSARLRFCPGATFSEPRASRLSSARSESHV